MKVLFVSNDPSIFDAGSAARERMRAYAKEIGELHVLSAGGKYAREERDGALILHPLRIARLLLILPMISRARALIRKESIEVVSAQDPFEYGWMALQATKGTHAKLSVQLHTDFLSPWFTRSGNFRSLKVRMPLLNSVRRILADIVLPHASGIRVVSKRIKDSLLERYGSRIPEPFIIPVGTTLIPPSAVPLPEHQFSFAFITVSRLEPEKRIEDILMALGRLGPRLHSVGLFIVGEGRERKKLEALVKKLGLQKRVVFTGWRTDDWGLMRSAQAFVQASAYEGYGVSLIKAALARIPIITTDVGIVGEVFKGYEDVLSVPPADPVNLAAQMNLLIGDHQLRLKLSMNAERTAQAHLTEIGDKTAKFVAHLKVVGSNTV
jgi:glycosyltransferase involved in cell wall biosynthesis